MIEVGKEFIEANKAKNRSMALELHYICKDCGADVSITVGELLNLDDRGLCLSPRCKECRGKKKNG